MGAAQVERGALAVPARHAHVVREAGGQEQHQWFRPGSLALPDLTFQLPSGTAWIKPRAWRIRLQLAIRNGRAVPPQGSAMNGNSPTYRVEIKQSGTAPNRGYGWQIYKNTDVLPILRSQRLFVSRMAGLADANRSRRQLVDADLQNTANERKIIFIDTAGTRSIEL